MWAANFALANPLNLTNSVATFAYTVGDRTTFIGQITLTGNNEIFGVAAGSTTLFAGALSAARAQRNTGQWGTRSPECRTTPMAAATTGTNIGGGNLAGEQQRYRRQRLHVTKGPLGIGPVNLTGGVLQNGNTNVADFVANSVTLHNTINLINGSASIGGPAIGTAAAGGDLTLAGPVNIFGPNNSLTVAPGINFTIFGPISGSGTLAKLGFGAMYLPNANPGWTGGITLHDLVRYRVGNSNSLGTGLVTLASIVAPKRGTLEDDGRSRHHAQQQHPARSSHGRLQPRQRHQPGDSCSR